MSYTYMGQEVSLNINGSFIADVNGERLKATSREEIEKKIDYQLRPRKNGARVPGFTLDKNWTGRWIIHKGVVTSTKIDPYDTSRKKFRFSFKKEGATKAVWDSMGATSIYKNTPQNEALANDIKALGKQIVDLEKQIQKDQTTLESFNEKELEKLLLQEVGQ